MPTWEKIYKAKNKGGKDWQKLRDGVTPFCFIEEVSPEFSKFIKQTKLTKKHVLDIGCGQGRYLVYLSSLGFQTDGVDSSQTAVKMTKKALGKKTGRIWRADMFKMKIPQNKYDLIISISTVQHGPKKDLQKLINNIHQSLLPDGQAFISIPDQGALKIWRTCKKYKRLNKNTVVPLVGPEIGTPHSFYSKAEIRKIFSQFAKLKMTKNKHGQWSVIGTK